jgi:hypothetical protein
MMILEGSQMNGMNRMNKNDDEELFFFFLDFTPFLSISRHCFSSTWSFLKIPFGACFLGVSLSPQVVFRACISLLNPAAYLSKVFSRLARMVQSLHFFLNFVQNDNQVLEAQLHVQHTPDL